MIRRAALILGLSVLMISIATSAWAGGGGAKTTGYIQITNMDSNATIGVIVDPTPDLLSITTIEEFLRAGGKILTPGSIVKFAVTGGDHEVYAGEAVFPANFGQTAVYVRPRKTVKLVVLLNSDGETVITPQP